MNIIITESQFKMICEQHPFAVQGAPDWHKESVESFHKMYPNLSNFMGDLALWAIPYVGPYIVATKNTAEGVILYKGGKKVEGIISILTSPLFLMRVVKILNFMGTTGNVVDMLKLINKTGVPLLISKGQESFMKWGWKEFGKDFKVFAELLKNENYMKPILNDVIKTL